MRSSIEKNGKIGKILREGRDLLCQPLFALEYKRLSGIREKTPQGGILYVCDTPYHLLISVIKALKSEERPSLLLSNKFLHSRTLVQRLRASGLFKKIYGISDRAADLMVYMEYHKYRWFCRWPDKKKKMERDFPILRRLDGYRIYLFNDTTVAGYYLQTVRKPYHLLEDGRNNYAFMPSVLKQRDRTKWVEARDYIWHSRHLSMGQSPLVRSLEVNARIPKFRYMKEELPLHVVSKELLFEGLHKEDREAILKIFGREDLSAWKKDLMGEKCTLLLTQPLIDLCQTMTEDRQRAIYQKMVQEYGEGKLLVKLHPRDKVSYDRIFPDAQFLAADFPAELFLLAGISFDTVICGISTAAESIAADCKITFSLEEFCRKYEIS